MSKWTGAIFGILDVLLSMPKNGDRNRKVYRDHETGGATNHPQTRKQTGHDGSCLVVEPQITQICVCARMCDPDMEGDRCAGQ